MNSNACHNKQIEDQIKIHNQNIKYIKYNMLANIFAVITFILYYCLKRNDSIKNYYENIFIFNDFPCFVVLISLSLLTLSLKTISYDSLKQL